MFEARCKGRGVFWRYSGRTARPDFTVCCRCVSGLVPALTLMKVAQTENPWLLPVTWSSSQ